MKTEIDTYIYHPSRSNNFWWTVQKWDDKQLKYKFHDEVHSEECAKESIAAAIKYTTPTTSELDKAEKLINFFITHAMTQIFSETTITDEKGNPDWVKTYHDLDEACQSDPLTIPDFASTCETYEHHSLEAILDEVQSIGDSLKNICEEYTTLTKSLT